MPYTRERILGDLHVGIEWGGRSAEVGFTFHPDSWGRGYATEATQAIVHYLFTDFGVSRVEASLHPDNPPSARVLEACGMVFEGLTRQSFWVGDECSDDMLYGMPRPDWEAWCNRPRHRPDQVDLVPVTAENRRAVGNLVTHMSQEHFVSPMLGNFRDALAPPSQNGATLVPWYRAIEADGEIVGFVMAAEMTEAHAHPYLWRLLVDRMHQRRGGRLSGPRPVRAVVPGSGSDRHRGVVGRGARLTGTHVSGLGLRTVGPGRRRRDSRRQTTDLRPANMQQSTSMLQRGNAPAMRGGTLCSGAWACWRAR